jgi:ElaB/YqjD/DUF883 family membrane-anchored ribosome-binding protein
MGAKSAEIEREIEAHRQAITEKMERLEGRLRQDIEGMTGAFTERVDRVRDQVEEMRLTENIREHPLASVLTALGVGTLLGVVNEAPVSEDRQRQRAEGRREPRGETFVDRFGGAISGTALMTMQDELSRFLREVMGGFSERERRAAA